MLNNKVIKAAMHSALVYCFSICALFGFIYVAVLSMNPMYTTNVIYLKSLGIMSLILIADDVAKFIGEKDKWAIIGIVSFSISLTLVSILPESLIVNFSIIEAAGLLVTPLLVFASLAKYVNRATRQVEA